MLIAIWNWLFTRRKWEIIKHNKIFINDEYQFDEYILRDQYGNLKRHKF